MADIIETRSEIKAVKFALEAFVDYDDLLERKDFLKKNFIAIPGLKIYFSYMEAELRDALKKLQEKENLLLFLGSKAIDPNEAKSSSSIDCDNDKISQKLENLKISHNILSSIDYVCFNSLIFKLQNNIFKKPDIKEILSNELAIVDPTMIYDVSSIKEILKSIEYHCSHSKHTRYPLFVIVSQPGGGKTRLLRELYMSLNQHSADLKIELNVKDVVMIPITFNSTTPATEIDMEWVQRREFLLPIVSRLIFSWLGMREDINDFCEFQVQFNRGLSSFPNVINDFSLRNIITKIKKHLNVTKCVLAIDEVTKLYDLIQDSLKFNQMVHMLCILQDDDADVFRLIFTGLKREPFLKVQTSSTRPIQINLLSPLGIEGTSNILMASEGISELVNRYEKEKSYIETLSLLISSLANWSQGLPRAIESIREVLINSKSQMRFTLSTIYSHSSKKLIQKYPHCSEIVPQIILYALYGKPIHINSSEEVRKVLDDAMYNGRSVFYDPENTERYWQIAIPIYIILNFDTNSLRNLGFSELIDMIDVIDSLSPNTFEWFNIRHELLIRKVRVQIKNLVNYSSVSFTYLYGGNDLPYSFSNEFLDEYTFDFTIPMKNISVKKTFISSLEFQESKEEYLYRPYFLGDQNPGFEWAYIAESTSPVKKYFVIVEQNKLTQDETFQEKDEIEKNWASSVKHLNDLGWTSDQILMVFKTNCFPRKYHSIYSTDMNVLLLCQDKYKAYLGPTCWSILNHSQYFLKMSTN